MIEDPKGAAPTAQPTPNENAPTLEDRGAEGEAETCKRPTNAEATSLAQPTPPDDERAALEKLLTAIDDANEQWARFGATCEHDGKPMIPASLLWSIVEPRGEYHAAALRQPGALPDEADIVAAVHAASATGRIALTVKDQDGTERPTNVATCFVRALAAKQAGKDPK